MQSEVPKKTNRTQGNAQQSKSSSNLMDRFTLQAVTEDKTSKFTQSNSKIKLFETRLNKILIDLTERFLNNNYGNIEIILSELMRIIISVQESNLNHLVLIESDLGRYFQGIYNIYTKLTHVPPNVIFYR